jgi:hypothetical protein
VHCFSVASASPLSEDVVDHVHANSASVPVMTKIRTKILLAFMTAGLLSWLGQARIMASLML